jgi:hypothetical protein
MNHIDINTLEDWQKFRQQNVVDVIVDPMLFRSADLFFSGKDAVGGKSDTIWNELSNDLDSLVAFFNQIVLADRLLLIDYGLTWRNRDLPEFVNRELEDDVVFTVTVQDGGEVSKKAREAALAALPERPAASLELKQSVLNQLVAFDYEFCPDLGGLNALPDRDLKLAIFLYGGLIFNAYARMSGNIHVLQPKRWRLLAAMLTNASSAAIEHEEKLIAELDRQIQANTEYQHVQLGSLPPLLPYLLSLNPRFRLDLLRIAKGLRSDPLIGEYRDYRRKLLRNWVEKGFIDEQHQKDITRVALEISERSKVDQHLGAEFGIGVKGPEAKSKNRVPIGRIWGLFLEQLPGRGYMKVLTRLKRAAQRYPEFVRYLKTLWIEPKIGPPPS